MDRPKTLAVKKVRVMATKLKYPIKKLVGRLGWMIEMRCPKCGSHMKTDSFLFECSFTMCNYRTVVCLN